jgi:hypothetical protein
MKLIYFNRPQQGWAFRRLGAVRLVHGGDARGLSFVASIDLNMGAVATALFEIT